MYDNFGRFYPDYPGQIDPRVASYMQPARTGIPTGPATGQTMTPPTIHADIIQVSNLEQVKDYPVGAGASQMFITQDESVIAVKSANANGYTLDVYDKRPPAPPEPVFDPSAYVRRDELNALLASAAASQNVPKRTTRKDAEE